MESELTELLNMPKAQELERKVLMKRQQGVSKNSAVVVSSELRLRPCNQCKMQG